MKTAGGVAAVVVPGGDCLAVDGDRPGACGGGAVHAVAGEANAQPVLPHATGCVAELKAPLRPGRGPRDRLPAVGGMYLERHLSRGHRGQQLAAHHDGLAAAKHVHRLPANT